MNHKGSCAFVRTGLLIVLIGLFSLIYSCNASNSGDSGDFGNTGGNNGGNGFRRTSGGLFITDDLSDTFRQVLVTVYKVEFVESGGVIQTVFTSDPGVTYDLRHLSGVLSPLSSGMPAGSYREVRITVGEEATLVDETGTKSPAFSENASTTCSAGRCVIAITGTFNVISDLPVVLDFDLKQFTFDPVTNTVTARVVVDADGSRHDTYAEERVDGPGAKGMVMSLLSDGFDLTLFRAVGFTPNGNLIRVKVNSDTKYLCDPHDPLPQCTFDAPDDVTAGLTLKVKGTWDGIAFAATEVTVTSRDDIDFSRLECAAQARSLSDFTELVRQPSIEADTYSFNETDASLTVGDRVILITEETFIRVISDEFEQVVCADAIPAAAGKVRVGFYEAKDAADQTVLIASKIRFGTSFAFDFGFGSDPGNFGDPGFGAY